MRHRIVWLATAFVFFVALTPANAQEVIKQMANVVALVKGEVTTTDGAHPGGVPIVFMRGTERVTPSKTKMDGKFSMVLTPGATYRIIFNDPQYMYHEDTLVIPPLKAYQEFPVAVTLTPLRDGQLFDISVPVFFPKATAIDAKAMPELDKILGEMKHNLKLSLSITVYPDKPVLTKKDAPQEKIATARAANLRSWLLGKNIPSGRYDVVSVTSSVPAGRFDLGPGYAVSDEPVSKKKKKMATPKKSVLVPQFVEIKAHLLQ